MKNLLFVFLVFVISGLLTPSIFSNSFASPEDAPGRDKGTKTANGCEKGTAKGNPNCVTGSPDGDRDFDGIPDSIDPCPDQYPLKFINGKPDHDGDGIIDSRDSETICIID